MKIGIVGVGAVGSTLLRYFKEFTDHNLALFDPDKNYHDSLKDVDAAFIAVPIPEAKDGQDYSHLESALERLKGCSHVFLRSTALPGTCDKYGLYSCPEFLTERFAYQEFLRLPIYTGCQTELPFKIFTKKTVIVMSNVECELAKMAHNCFGALKVTYFNHVRRLAQIESANYQNVLDCALHTGFINKHHTQVPGHDGQYGYGGKCFPTNVKAMTAKYHFPLLSQVDTDNEIFRQTVPDWTSEDDISAPSAKL